MKARKKRKLNLRKLNLQAILNTSDKTASIVGLTEPGGRKQLGKDSSGSYKSSLDKRIFIPEATFISR
jgi:hypothetical protein